jgi:hypothetical protein
MDLKSKSRIKLYFLSGVISQILSFIKSFETSEKYPISAICFNGTSRHGYVKNIQKVKKPLFTTEDGVEIFEGNDYWVYDYGDYHPFGM